MTENNPNILFWRQNLENLISLTSDLFILKNRYFKNEKIYRLILQAENKYFIFCKRTLIELGKIFSQEILLLKFSYQEIELVEIMLEALEDSNIKAETQNKLARIKEFLISIKLKTLREKLNENELENINKAINLMKYELFS